MQSETRCRLRTRHAVGTDVQGSLHHHDSMLILVENTGHSQLCDKDISAEVQTQRPKALLHLQTRRKRTSATSAKAHPSPRTSPRPPLSVQTNLWTSPRARPRVNWSNLLPTARALEASGALGAVNRVL